MNNQDYYNKEYVPQVNKIGKITGYLGVLLSFTPAICASCCLWNLTKTSCIINRIYQRSQCLWVLWFVEPISYFPVVGAAGTYMAFLSGNISNMRIPCASIWHSGRCRTREQEQDLLPTLGMAVSIVINVSVLTIGQFLELVLSMLPDTIKPH